MTCYFILAKKDTIMFKWKQAIHFVSLRRKVLTISEIFSAGLMTDIKKKLQAVLENLVSLILCFSREQCYVKQFAIFVFRVGFYHDPFNPATAPLLS